MCLEEAEQEQSDGTSEGTSIEDPFLDLVGTGFEFFDVQLDYRSEMQQKLGI